MTEPVTSSTEKKKKPADAPLATGTTVNLGSKMKALVLLSKVWASTNVGVYLDIPIAGTPLQRYYISRYALYAFEKTAVKLFNAQSLGAFNYRMRKDGIEDFVVRCPIGSDGAPVAVRAHLTAKSHRVGVVLGNLLAKISFQPAVGDLSTPYLLDLPRDKEVLLWTAQKFLESLSKADVALIGGKVASVKESVKTKFDKAFAKATSPDLKGAKAPASDPDHKLMKEALAFEYKAKLSPSALVVAAQAMSGHGVVGYHGDSLTLCTDPHCAKYAWKASNATLSNLNKSAGTVRLYERIAAKDKASGMSLQTALSIAGIACGLPVEVGRKLLSEKEIKGESVANELAKMVEDAKK